jgi:hypothetical protein
MNTQNRRNISSNNETTSPQSSSSSPFIISEDGNVDNPLQSIDIFLQDYWNENYRYVEESDLHEPRMTENRDGQILTNDEWAKIQERIENYRSKIPQSRRIFK